MTLLKRILAVLAAILIAVQFIRPARNASSAPVDADSTGKPPIPEDVRQILAVACFDCHTNNTRYPWYAEVQPVGWWLAGHIRDAKKQLNFDEFGLYQPRRKFGKFRQIEEQLDKGEMPLPSYLIIHKDAVLPAEKKELLIAWSRAMRDSLRAHYPPETLERRPPR
jgi:hypothetical protein